jgi:hypothetical protein
MRKYQQLVFLAAIISLAFFSMNCSRSSSGKTIRILPPAGTGTGTDTGTGSGSGTGTGSGTGIGTGTATGTGTTTGTGSATGTGTATSTGTGTVTSPVDCPVFEYEYATGHYTSEGKTDSLIKVLNYGEGRTNTKGWMKFDLSFIPPGATVAKVVLNFYVSSVGDSIHSVKSSFLNVDPVTASAAELLNGVASIIRTDISFDVSGWKDFEFPSDAVTVFNAEYLPSGHVSINLYGTYGIYGKIEAHGYEYAPSLIAPYLTVWFTE